jgi:Fe-S-cluster containining protein
LNDGEIAEIARFLGLQEREFIEAYTRLRANRAGLSLTEQADGACVFLAGRDCRIQPVKPRQCREFPNGWNFPGWRDVCCAIPVAKRSKAGEGSGRG